MEVGPSAEQSLVEAKKLADTLEKLANRAQAVQEVLHSVKFPEALDKLHRDYTTLRAKITTLENQTGQEIESFKIERIVRVNNIAQLIKSARQRTSKAYDDLEHAKQMGDMRSIRMAEQAMDAIYSEIDCHSLSVELQSLKNVDLVAPEKYAAVEALLNRPLHYLKTSSLSPTDLSMSVMSEQTNVGQAVEIEIRQARCEKRIMELLSVRVQDGVANDLPKRQDMKQRVDGTASVIVKFTPKSVGRHVITVLIYGEHVRGSPLSLVVEPSEPNPPVPPSSYEPVAPAIVLSSSSSMARSALAAGRLTNAIANSAFRPISVGSYSQSSNNGMPENVQSMPSVRSNGLTNGDSLSSRPSSNVVGLGGFGRGQFAPSTDRIAAFHDPPRLAAAPLPTIPHQYAPVGRQNSSPPPSSTAVGMLIDIDSGHEEKNVNGQSEGTGQRQLQQTTAQRISSPPVNSTGGGRPSQSRQADRAIQGQAVPMSNNRQNSAEDWDALPTGSPPSNGLPMQMLQQQMQSMIMSQQRTSPTQTPLPIQPQMIKTERKTRWDSVESWDRQQAPAVQQQQTSPPAAPRALPTVKVKLEVDSDSFSFFSQQSKTSPSPTAAATASNRNRINLLDLYEKSAPKAIVGTQTLVMGVAGRDNDTYIHLSKPIGCTYDEQSNHWIVCDTGHNMIKLFDADGRPNTLLKDGLNAPSAAVVVEPGSTFAIKDDVAIMLYDQRSGNVVLNVAEHLRKPMGLGLDGHGRLVTLTNAFHGVDADIQSFDVRSPLQAVSTFPYRPDFSGNRNLLKPRFITVDGDLLAITDLGVDLVFLTSLTDGKTVKTFGGKSGRPGEFMFVSGVRFDGARNMLIGDAKGNRVQLFDASGTFKCRLEVNSPIGFVSDLHLTDDGRLMCLDRGKNIAKVYQLAGRD